MANNRKKVRLFDCLRGILISDNRDAIGNMLFFLTFIQVVSAVSLLVNVYRSGEKKLDF